FCPVGAVVHEFYFWIHGYFIYHLGLSCFIPLGQLFMNFIFGYMAILPITLGYPVSLRWGSKIWHACAGFLQHQ
ncbi:MAG: hypothetical protein KAT71_03630, partial [Gammaproteobacteria bacterium]|nr:hypothetical protein [Gammaproteobacteria bacterium]